MVYSSVSFDRCSGLHQLFVVNSLSSNLVNPWSFSSLTVLPLLDYHRSGSIQLCIFLASFTQCNAAEIHPPNLCLFYVSTICSFVSLRSVLLYSITDLFIHSLAEGYLNCFQFLVNVNWATKNDHIWCVCLCVWGLGRRGAVRDPAHSAGIVIHQGTF